jgi:hypothetical protein
VATSGARKTPRGARPNRRGGPARPAHVALEGERRRDPRVGCLSPGAIRDLEEWSPFGCMAKATRPFTKSGLQAHPLLILSATQKLKLPGQSQNPHTSRKTKTRCMRHPRILSRDLRSIRCGNAIWASVLESHSRLNGPPAVAKAPQSFTKSGL